MKAFQSKKNERRRIRVRGEEKERLG